MTPVYQKDELKYICCTTFSHRNATATAWSNMCQILNSDLII